MNQPHSLPSEVEAETWSTWDRVHRVDDVRTVRPRTMEELTETVVAARDAGLGLRPAGSGHSFNELASPRDVRLDLTELTGLLEVNRGTNQARFLAGTTLIRAAKILEGEGLAFSNLPDVLHQTVAGAISTATHGTGTGYASLSGQVCALTLVTADGEFLECSPAQNREVFQAARAGLGVIGVIAAVTFQCEPSFRLHSAEFKEPVDQLVDALGERTASADHFEFFWSPSNGSAHSHILTRLHRLPDEWSKPGSKVAQTVRRMDDTVLRRGLPLGLNRLAGWAPKAVPGLNRLDTLAASSRRFTDLSYKVFASARPVKFVQTEWGVPIEDLPGTFKDVRKLLERTTPHLGLPLAVRCAAPEEAWMSPAHGRYTGWISVRQFWRNWSPEVFDELQSVFMAHEARPHWGTRHTLDAQDLAPKYTHWEDFLRIREHLDPDGVFLTDPVRRLLGI
ncbi:FAD-binding protein [Kocuria sp. JC486]|uniref:D-arabinono-1,4-lactone oxidase n=1 Tax=Kocuria sp. JC486 TaxID=1970736 RepID=UPI00141E25BA|nr:D-arabinono-1,4-lactone oxidase [Kocuria sp. JC486]NHU85437.1 FAD-binding protein [Kocuria sp. JC486]